MKRNPVTEDGDAFDERGLLKDGRSSRVGMMMRDSLTPVQQAVLDRQTSMMTDVLHKPGYVLDTRTEHQKKSVEDAYAAADLRDADAWRGDKPKDAAPDDLDHKRQAAAEALWRANAASFVNAMRGAPNDLAAAYALADQADASAWRKGKD